MSDDIEPADEQPDAAPDASENETGSESSEPESSGPPKKRWFDRGLVWVGVVVVLAVLALAVSFIAADKGPSAADIAAPTDVRAFCTAAKNFGEGPPITIDIGESATALTTRVTLLDALAQEAPPAMAVRINRFKESLQPVIELIETPEAEGQAAIVAVSEALDAQAAATADDGDEISEYILLNCGFRPEDLAPPPDTEEPADDAPDPSDPEAFCAAARSFAEAPPPIAPVRGGTGSADGYQAYSDALAALAPSAPPSIARRIDNITTALEGVIGVIGGEAAMGPGGFDAVGAAMDEQERLTAADAAQLQAYVERVCRFDMAEVHNAAQEANSESSTSTEDPSVTPPSDESPDDTEAPD